MPDFGYKSHLRWLERVFCSYPDVDLVLTAFVWCVWRAFEVALEVCEVCNLGATLWTGDGDAGVCVLENILDLLL